MAIQIPAFIQDLAKRIPSLTPKKATETQIQKTIGLNIGHSSLVVCEVSKQGEQLTLKTNGTISPRDRFLI